MKQIKALETDLVSDMDLEQVFQKHVIDGRSFLFALDPETINEEYKLRHDIAVALSINLNDVIIVGSAKLGFSVKTTQFVKFDSRFNSTRVNRDKSDIDIAIINKDFFERQTRVIYNLSRHFDREWICTNWKENAYYQGKRGEGMFDKYVRYLAQGWFRPDYAPNLYLDRVPWKNVKDQWFEKMKRKISFGVYSDWYYLKYYHMDHLGFLKENLKQLNITLGGAHE